MPQYPVPQFIEEEGKIISFLTYRQFFELVGGGAVVILLYWIIPWFTVFIMCALLVAAITGGIAFVRIGNASIVTVIMNFLGFTMQAKTYTWKKKEFNYSFTGGGSEKRSPQTAPTKESLIAPTLTPRPSKLQGIQKAIDTKK